MYKASFYENGKYLNEVSNNFMKLAQGHTYQYYDLTVGDRRIEITPTGPHPPHQERWKKCVKERHEDLFKGATVLDLGGAEGFYSIKANLLGADRVIMVERSSKALSCAKFIFDFLNIRNIDIRCQDIRDFEFKEEYDIIFLMRIVHWFDGAYLINEGLRLKILGSVSNHLRKVCFVNLDTERIMDFLDFYEDDFNQIIHGGEGFMGYMELWK